MASQSVTEHVEQEALAFALDQAGRSGYVALGGTLVIALMAWPETGPWAAIGWAAASGITLLTRNRLMRRVGAHIDSPRGMRQANEVLNLSSVVLALVLGALPMLFFPTLGLELRLLLTLFFCCWCAAAMPSIGARPRLYLAYLAVVLGSLAVGWLRAPGLHAAYVIAALFMYGLVLHVFSRNFARRIAEGIAIRAENADLVHRLSLANDAKTRFIMAASHDLRQPLHAISYLGGVLSRPLEPQDAREASQALLVSVRALDKLFSAILDLSRIESGAVQPTLSDVRVDLLVARLENDYRPVCMSRGRRWQCQLERATARTDPALLERVLRNLLDNALKHGGDGAVTISVTAGDPIRIVVSDTGPGIALHERDRVFQEFYRSRDSVGAPGLGLGLSIVARLVERLGCRLQIDFTDPPSRTGARIELEVPRGVEQPDGEAPVVEDPDTAPDVGGLRVLAVDDDPSVLQATRALLRQWGCIVAVCSDLKMLDEVLEVFGAPEVALIDYKLEDTRTGLDVADTLRGRYPDIGLVIVTGESDADVLRMLKESDMPLLEKPVSPHELRLTLSLFRTAID